MSKKRKILFVLPTLGAGGAQRILAFLSKNIANNNFETHLLIVGNSSDAAYSIEGMKVTFLNQKRVLNGIPRIILFVLKYRPSIVLSSIGHLNTVFGLIAPFFVFCKFVIRESSVITFARKYSGASKFYGFLSKIAYKNIDLVICQSQDMAIDFIKLYNMSEDKVVIINNPITELFPMKAKSQGNEIIKFITVGRLNKVKGHARILEVLAKLHDPFQYTIIGNGPEMENIQKQVVKLGLSERVHHIPFSNKIGEELAKHDIFLQGSYVEGFPNAVLESCVVGTPVIAFDVPGGTSEIIQECINGHLVSTQNEFYQKLGAISNKLWDPKIVRESVINKFDEQKILVQYENLFIKLISS